MIKGALFDSGDTLTRPIGGRWNPRFDFEEVLARHCPEARSELLADAVAPASDSSMTPEAHRPETTTTAPGCDHQDRGAGRDSAAAPGPSGLDLLRRSGRAPVLRRNRPPLEQAWLGDMVVDAEHRDHTTIASEVLLASGG